MRMAGWTIAILFASLALGADFDQPFRPQFHFSPDKNWTNDPNGPVYFEGEYHLFFQYNPFGDQWGHMSWGHAVSRDLIHWEQLPVALPEENGVMIFTGSTVVDEHNSSGFCKGEHGCLVAIYTGHTPESEGKKSLQTQNIAYSNDRGRTWTKYASNPVLDLHMTDFRDPNVFWSKESKRWIMAVALPNEHKVRLFASADLKKWTAVSDFGPAGATGGQWECPDLFELPVEGKPGQRRWILKVGINPGSLQGGSGEQYFIGHFDGTEFKNENPANVALWTDYGKDCYCALTFNNLPKKDSAVMIGWMSNWQYASKLPTSPWRGQMTLPRRLSLRETAVGIRLFQAPVDELQELATGKTTVINPSEAKVELGSSHTYQILLSVEMAAAMDAGWKISSKDGHYLLVGYDKSKGVLYVDRSHSGSTKVSDDFFSRIEAPAQFRDPLTLDIVMDRLSTEVFANHGALTMTDLVFPDAGPLTLEFYSKGGTAGKTTAEVRELGSAHK